MRQGIMLCNSFSPDRLKKWVMPCIAQPKINGDRCRAIITSKGQVTLWSSQANEILSVPHINEDIARCLEPELEKFDFDTIELDGELYRHGMSHQEIRSIVGRTVNLHPNYRLMQYHVFDLIYPEVGQGWRLSYLYKLIAPLFHGEENVLIVPSIRVNCLKEIEKALANYISCGFEGIILRDDQGIYERKRSASIMKLKPRKEDIFKIVDVVQEEDKSGYLKNSLGAFTCCARNGKYFNVGTGPLLTRMYRMTAWKYQGYFYGKRARIKFQDYTDGGIPYFTSLQEVMD